MSINYALKARQCVAVVSDVDVEDLYVVWFTKTLANWKAMVSTDTQSGQYWEVTHNGAKHETYVDFYLKANNSVVTDSHLEATK